MIGVLGDAIFAICTVQLNFTVPGCAFEYDYGFTTTTTPASTGTTAVSTVTVSPVNISLAGEYTCTVTVRHNDFCQGVGSEQVFTPRTSDVVTLRVQCMCIMHVCLFIGLSPSECI